MYFDIYFYQYFKFILLFLLNYQSLNFKVPEGKLYAGKHSQNNTLL